MRKLSLLLALLCAVICANSASSQSLLDKTSFAPANFQYYSTPITHDFGNGYRFVGTKHTSTLNGKVTSVCYTGSAMFPDGGRMITLTSGYALNERFQPHDGFFWEIEPNGDTFRVQMKDGKQVSYTRETQKYVIENNCIVFQKTAQEYQMDAAAAAAYGNYGTSSGSSSGTTYNSHSATCRGCNGSGRCQHCGGTGWVNNNRSKCSLCHGTGRCQSCAGTGKIHGNF